MTPAATLALLKPDKQTMPEALEQTRHRNQERERFVGRLLGRRLRRRARADG